VLADPASAEAWGRLGAVFDAHGLDGHAAACYERAMQLDPGDFRWVYFLGIVRDVLGAPPDEAIELLRAAAALAPRYPPVHARMADVLARAGRWAEAQTVYEHVLELAPDYPIARRGLGQALLARGDAAAAAGQLEYAIRLRDGDRGTYAALAQAYARLGREGDARAAAEAARDMSTAFSYRDSIRGQNVGDVATSSTAVMNRARFMMANDQWELALADLKLAEQMLPEDAWVQHQLGRVYRRLGRNDLAEHHFARARALQQE
jgi:tetratricopeptide (TPR) repeat protein